MKEYEKIRDMKKLKLILKIKDEHLKAGKEIIIKDGLLATQIVDDQAWIKRYMNNEPMYVSASIELGDKMVQDFVEVVSEIIED